MPLHLWPSNYNIVEWKLPEWKFRSAQNGSAFQNVISEWKCIPEWNIYVGLNGPYGLPYITVITVITIITVNTPITVITTMTVITLITHYSDYTHYTHYGPFYGHYIHYSHYIH